MVTPEPSATAELATALVTSPNGLWLREAPGGNEQLELIPDGTSLTLLPGVEEVDGATWQQILTPAGNEGWVGNGIHRLPIGFSCSFPPMIT